MKIVLKQELKRIKNGYASRSPILRLVAHGPTPDLAARNLERLVGLYLRPFQREGTLDEELQATRLDVEHSGGELIVAVTS